MEERRKAVSILRFNRVKYITVFAAIMTLFLFICLIWGLADFSRGPAGKQVEKQKAAVQQEDDDSSFKLVALGDSLTRGTGDESGKGYVGYLSDSLRKRMGDKLTVQNLGIAGQVTGELAEQLEQKEVRRQIGMADAITMTIGGNDLFQGGQALIDLDMAEIEMSQKEYLASLKKILGTIRSENKEAAVFLIGLYNPFIELEDSDTTSSVVREWNFQTEQLAESFEKIVFVPSYDLFQLSVNDYLYSDKFHPNQEGYKLIAERLVPLIKWEEEKE